MNGELFYEQVKFLEPHLVIRICDYYAAQNTFDQQWILKEKIAALLKTRQYDQLKQEVVKLNDQSFPNLDSQIDACKKDTSEQGLGDKTKSFWEEMNTKYTDIEKAKFDAKVIIKFCSEIGEFKEGILRKLTQYCFIVYEVGRYEVALKMINCLLSLNNHLQQDNQVILNLLWGKIGCELVLQKFDDAKETVKMIRFKLDHEDFEAFIELVSNEKYLATIQMVCSEVIRYIACALLLVRSQHYNLTSLLTSFTKGVFDYKDSLIEFLKLTLIDFQFNAAEQTLKSISNEISKDYFLSFQKEQIITAAQHLFFKTYCKVFDVVEIKMVSSFLNCSASEAETWIVNFIKVSNIEAKIDSENGIVNITKKQSNFDETVNNKLKDIVPRTVLLVNNLKRVGSNN